MSYSAVNTSHARTSFWLWAALFFACALPRAAMALKLGALCNDAVFYIDLAEGYERGDLDAGLGRLGLNTYPPILAALHRFGLSWQATSEVWGVLAASLAVWPLYGWVRLQFNERTALVGALLYAFHPKLIEWSPELLRDSTFWLLAGLSLYASWRAATESRAGWFLAAGVSIALAVHTRFEGWFLYLPLAGWTVTSTGADAGWSRKLAGLALSFAMCPLLLLAVNLTLLKNHDRWEWGNFERLNYVAQWWRANWAADEKFETAAAALPVVAATSVAGAAPAPQAPARMPLSKLAVLYGNTFRRGFGAIFGIAWLVGFASARRRLLKADYGLLFLVAGCVFAAAWVHCWYAQATSSRYFLTIVLLALPCSATGWLWTYDRAVVLAERISASSRLRKPAFAVSVIATLLAGVGESMADHHDGRSRDAALGQWLLAELGPQSRIATIGPMPLVGFYAQTRANTVTAAEACSLDTTTPRPQAIVAARRRTNAPALNEVLHSAKARGYRPVNATRLPVGYEWGDVLVLVASVPSAGGQR